VQRDNYWYEYGGKVGVARIDKIELDGYDAKSVLIANEGLSRSPIS
jgi:hypothetical protein